MHRWSIEGAGEGSDAALEELFHTETHELFRRAQAAAAQKAEVLATPCIVNRACQTSPACRHCKWPVTGAVTGKFAKNTVEAALAHAHKLESKGVNRMFIASGWMGYELPENYYEIVRVVRAESNLELYGLFGALNRPALERLKAAGLDGYLCGLESPSETAYKSFRPGGDTLLSRVEALRNAKAVGLKLWTGFLYGFGETEDDMKQALLFFKELAPESLSILPFEPFPGTEMEACDPPNLYQWARIVAIGGLYLGDVNVFVSRGEPNTVLFGKCAGANAYYCFPT